ncbi:class I SAM-dependent methyltransferase [Candidatus Ponderosibacter sp. Uisw_141_02]|uniref:class I SAM-dependent methyltransferase n=1 Tax=Candidatus Ponderosibacter sp. Uisw_141_02 TaxID=3231000 RepID=UPI003D549B3B
MQEIDFISIVHKRTTRDYLARVNDTDFPKAKAATLAKKWDFDYWDGDRRVNYGGYKYIPDLWRPVANAIAQHYHLREGDKVLDVGCGKGFQLFEISQSVPGIIPRGLDCSSYALKECKPELSDKLVLGCATELPFDDNEFDFVYSINTLHNLKTYELEKALKEIERVGKKNKYICVESYRDEVEKANLLYWQVTCEAFCTPEEWKWWFEKTGYSGDFSFIYFE